MGKSQKKKAMRRHNPMRVPDSHLPKGLSAAASSSTKTEAILPILQKMESTDAADRKWACIAVSNLIQNDPSTRRLLQGKNVVGALITRLTDAEEEVIVEAMGALRNLCIDGGYDICAEMYNKNILTPLKAFIVKISENLSQSDAVPKDSPVFSLAENVITTLWCLSETSNKALNAINAIDLVPFLMSFVVSRDTLPLAPVAAAAQCLYVLTDDNDPAIAGVRANASYIASLLSAARLEPSALDSAKDISSHRSITLSVLASGILQNISPLPPPSLSSTIDVEKEVILPLLMPVIASISLADISTKAQTLATRQASEPDMEKLSIKNTPKSDYRSPTEMELELLETKLRTVQLALEILTGTCATLPDLNDPIEDDSENMDDDDASVEDASMDIEEDNISSNESTAMLPALVPPLLALIHPTSLSFPPLAAASLYPPITSALSAVHVSALQCLGNIFLGLSVHGNPAVSQDTTAGRKVWEDVWSALAVVGTESGLGQERRKDIWEASAGVLWGVGNVWKGQMAPNEEQVRLLIQLYEAASDTALRVKCIGTLDCLAQFQSPDSNRVISDYLVSLLPPSASVDVETLLQAVSALIDTYSDETLPNDINFRNGGYLEKLAASVEGVKRAVKTIDRRKPGGRELRRRGDEIWENLRAFIQYRKDLRL
ncbi:armadillo-type protein [Mycena floridula]|nr:armadillo-type protein [Mycena floridula]